MLLTILCVVVVLAMGFGLPIGTAMILGSIAYIAVDPGIDMVALPHKLLAGVDSFVYISIPFFVLVGGLMGRSGILDRLLRLCQLVFQRMTGGLALVNVSASVAFSGVSGTASAEAAAIGSAMIPAMKREGYSSGFAAAVTASGSTIGPITPPSVPMVILGSLVSVSIGRLFLAGIVPGLIAGLLIALFAYLISRRRGYRGVGVERSPGTALRVVVGALGPLLVPLIIVGGIVGGIFTPTEASAIAILVVLLLGIVHGRLGVRGIWESIIETVYMFGPVMLILAATAIFADLLVLQRAGDYLAHMLLGISKNPTVVLFALAILVLVLGTALEPIPIMLMMAPVLMPVVNAVGIDPVHFGMVFIQSMMIGLITPPVGISMFIACSIANASMGEFTREVIPFIAALVIAMVVTILMPSLILWIPDLFIPQGQ